MNLLPTSVLSKLFMLAVNSPMAFSLCIIAVTCAAIGAGYIMNSFGIGLVVWVIGIGFMSTVVMTLDRNMV